MQGLAWSEWERPFYLQSSKGNDTVSQGMHRNETEILQSRFLHGLSNPPPPWALRPAEPPQPGRGHLLECERVGQVQGPVPLSHPHPGPPYEGLTFQVLDDAPQAVPVSSNEHPFAGFDLGDNLLIPEGQGPGDGVLEALTGGQFPRLQACVPALLGMGWGGCRARRFTSPAVDPPPGHPFLRPLTPGLPLGHPEWLTLLMAL